MIKTHREVFTDKAKTYTPYPDGEVPTAHIIRKMSDALGDIYDLYLKELPCFVSFTVNPSLRTAFEFFQTELVPAVAKDSTAKQAAAYTCIANTFLCNEATLYKAFLNYFIDSSGSDSFELGGLFDSAHHVTTYAAFMHTAGLGNFKVNADRGAKKGSANCPVDIEIIDNSTSEVVGRITSNVADEEIAAKENAVVMTVDGDEKSYWLPADGDYSVVITGNDDGQMDYTVAYIDSVHGESERTNYFDVPVVDGESMTGSMADTEDGMSVTLLSASHEEITPDEIITDLSNGACTISLTVEGSGLASGPSAAISGDYVTYSAEALCSTFYGWYDSSDTLITDETTYTLRAAGDTTIKAKFSEGSHTYGETVVAPTCTQAGYTLHYCENCGHSYNTDYSAPLGHRIRIRDGNPATCTEDGWEPYEFCTRCDNSTYSAIHATHHYPIYIVDEDNPDDCIAHWYCPLCGEAFTERDCSEEFSVPASILSASIDSETSDLTCRIQTGFGGGVFEVIAVAYENDSGRMMGITISEPIIVATNEDTDDRETVCLSAFCKYTNCNYRLFVIDDEGNGPQCTALNP